MMDKILGIRELISVHTQISELERKEALQNDKLMK